MVDRLFEAMSNTQRRRVLVALLERDSREDVPIPEAVHTGEKTLTGLRREMHHSHLPKLEAMGFVRWDQDSQTVTRGPQFEEIEPLLRLLLTNEDALPADFP
jgi:hypothetical protein